MNIRYNRNQKTQQTTMLLNYREGNIYKIYNTITDDIYIGSTAQKLCERMRGHRQQSKLKPHFNYPTYKAFREHGIENFFIELLEKCTCNDRGELRKTEGDFIRTLKPSLNKRIEGRLNKEHYQDNLNSVIQKSREYANQNRESITKTQRLLPANEGLP